MFFYYFKGFYNYVSDETIYTYGAIRILNGQVLYKDFFSMNSPGNYYLIAGLFKLFGVKNLLVVMSTLATFSLIVLFMYLIAKELELSELFSIMAIIFFLADKPQKFMFYSHHWLSTLFALISAYCFVRFVSTRSILTNFLSGLFASITVMFFYVKGIPLFGVSLICIFLLSRVYRLNFLKHISFYLLGFIASLLPIFLYYLLNGALFDLFYYWFFWSLKNYSNLHDYPSFFYPIKVALRNSYFSENLFSVVISTLPALFTCYNFFIATGVFIGIYLLEKNKNFIVSNIKAVMFLFITFAIFISTFYRPDDLRFAIISPFTLICYMVSLKIFNQHFGNITLSKIFKRIFLFFALGIPSLISLFSLLANINYSIIIFPKDFKKIDTSRGSIYVNKNDLKTKLLDVIVPVLRYENARKIFLYHCGGDFLYFYFDFENPIKYDCVIPHYNSPKEVEEALNELRLSDVEFIIIIPSYFFLFWNEQYFPAIKHLEIDKVLTEDPIINYVRKNYIPVLKFGEVKIKDKEFYLCEMYKRK